MRACCRPALGARASWNYQLRLVRRRRGRGARELRHEPAAAPGQPAGTTWSPSTPADQDRPGAGCWPRWITPTRCTPAPRSPRSGAARAERRRHRLRGRLPRVGIPRGRLPVRRGRRRVAGGPLVTAFPASAFLYECQIRHVRAAPVRNVFSYRTYQWLVDTDDLPRLPGGSGRWPASAPPTTSATRAAASGRTWTGSWPPAGSTWRRAGHDAGPRPGARPRVQPADRVLVPRPVRVARVRRGRGAQHLRRAALLPAAHRRGRPRRRGQGVLRLARSTPSTAGTGWRCPSRARGSR